MPDDQRLELADDGRRGGRARDLPRAVPRGRRFGAPRAAPASAAANGSYENSASAGPRQSVERGAKPGRRLLGPAVVQRRARLRDQSLEAVEVELVRLRRGASSPAAACAVPWRAAASAASRRRSAPSSARSPARSSPQSSSTIRSIASVRFALTRRSASSARLLSAPQTSTSRSPSRTSRGPRIRKSICAPRRRT